MQLLGDEKQRQMIEFTDDKTLKFGMIYTFCFFGADKNSFQNIVGAKTYCSIRNTPVRGSHNLEEFVEIYGKFGRSVRHQF